MATIAVLELFLRMLTQPTGVSPAAAKRHAKRTVAEARTFGFWARDWVAKYKMAESTRAMRKGVLFRDVLPAFDKRKMWEVTEGDVRQLCERIVDRGAPATAVQGYDRDEGKTYTKHI